MMPIIANSITRYCGWETRPRPGADLNGAWHLRNAKIFAKLMQTAGRVLVIFGSGHAYLAPPFRAKHACFRTIEPGDYLQ